MATIYFSGYLFQDDGEPLADATVQLYQANTTTTEGSSATTDSAGLWELDETTDGASGTSGATRKYDVKITSGSSVRWRRWSDSISLKSIDVRNNEGEGVPAATFTNFANGDDMEIVHYRGLRGTGAADDNMFFRYYMHDASGNITEMANMAVNLVDHTADSEDVKIVWQIKAGAGMVDALTIASTSGAVVSTAFNQNALTFGTGTDTDISLTFNANSADGVITWMEDEDYFAFSDEILMNTDEKIHLRDTAIYIYSSTDGQLDLVADTEIQIAATTIDINGAVALNGAVTGATNITLSGELDAATLDLSSSADIAGDLVLSGGADGALQFTNAGENSIKIPNNQASALIIEEANNAYITFVTTNSSEAITVAKATTFSVAATLATGTTIGNLTLANGSITDSGGALDFGNETMTTTGVITAGGFTIGSAAILEEELEILDGATVTTTELNLIDGGTARGTTAVASGDGLLVNDGGTMRMTNVDTVSTYFSSHNVGGGNIVTTGALDSGSITSGFGNINNGSSTITTTGAADLGDTTVDSLTSTGDITTTGQATDWDLVDNNASALSFDASGKTGILDIVTTNSSEGVTMSGTLGVTGTATFDGAVYMKSGISYMGVDNTTSGNLYMYGGSSGDEGAEIRMHMTNDNDGSYEFFRVDVSGTDFRIGKTGAIDFKIAINGDTYTNDGSISSLSDSRLKKEVATLSDGLSIVNQLRPVTYKYNGTADMAPNDNVVRYGLVADEVQAVASQYVTTTTGKISGTAVNDLKTLSATKMIPMLIKSIQELSARVVALES